MRKKFSRNRTFYSLRGAVAHFNIAHTHIYLHFQYCLDETISLYKGAHDSLLLILKCPFKEINILWEAMIGLEKSFQSTYSNTHLRIRETLPLKLSTISLVAVIFKITINVALSRAATVLRSFITLHLLQPLKNLKGTLS